jgi:hypothetical protein
MTRLAAAAAVALVVLVPAHAARTQETPAPVTPAHAGRSSAEVLDQATRALDRFQDVAVAEDEGYRKPWRNDGFMMGEHWFSPALLGDPACRLDQPEFLQYLVIDGKRTLIGTGYVCDAGQPTPEWFGSETVWHQHGPELCRFRSGVFHDASYFARALPNPLNDETWEDVCESWWAEPVVQSLAMLHTWNWVAHPDGPFVHENRAIPFLREGLKVPSRSELDAPAGRAALETLRLAHGDESRRYEGAFRVADLGPLDAWSVRRKLRRAQRTAEAAVERMRSAERLGDAVMWAAAARDGAAALETVRREISEGLAPAQREVIERFLASLVVHEHHTEDPAAHHHE